MEVLNWHLTLATTISTNSSDTTIKVKKQQYHNHHIYIPSGFSSNTCCINLRLKVNKPKFYCVTSGNAIASNKIEQMVRSHKPTQKVKEKNALLWIFCLFF